MRIEPWCGQFGAQVKLQAELGLEVTVAHLVAQRALVHAVAGQLADVGGTETTGRIGPQVQMLGGVPHGAHAGGEATKIALESLETHVAVIDEFAAVEMAVVEAHTTVDGPVADVGSRRDEGTEVKQVIVGNQELVALIARTLPHAAHATGDAPVFTQAPGHVVNVVVNCVQLEVKTVLVGLLKFLAAVLLVSQHGIESPLPQIERIIEHGLVVIHLLVRQAMVIGLSVGIRLFQFACQRVTLALGDAGGEVEIGANKARVSPCLVDTQHARKSALAKLRIRHIAVAGGLVGMGEFIAITQVP